MSKKRIDLDNWPMEFEETPGLKNKKIIKPSIEFKASPLGRKNWNRKQKLIKKVKKMDWKKFRNILIIIVLIVLFLQANSQAQKDFNAWENEPRVEEPIRNITGCPNGDSIPLDDPKCQIENETPPASPKQVEPETLNSERK